MLRSVLAFVMIAASATAASAGGYVGVGIGTGPGTSGDIAFDEDGRSGRLMIGYRLGRFSIEGMGTRYDLLSVSGHPYEATTLALAGKLSFPLGHRFEAFGRGGIVQTEMDGPQPGLGFEGRGYLFGGGFEYRIDLVAAGVGIFVDYTIQRNTLSGHDNRQDLGFTTRLWTLGGIVYF
jgi:hypothetical protein